MSYESIVLELMSRIKVLEDEFSILKEKVIFLEQLVENLTSSDEIDAEAETPEVRTVPYGKMTDEMIETCYIYGKMLHLNPDLEIGAMADQIFDDTGMNRNSAFMYVYVVDSMLGGKVYKRAINTKATRAYLGKIHAEYGKEGLRKAINALRAHIRYRQSLGHTVSGLVELCQEYDGLL